MMDSGILLLTFPLMVFLCLLFWLLLPRRSGILFLIPSLIPLTALSYFIAVSQGGFSEITLPFMTVSDQFALDLRFQFDPLRTALAWLVSLLCFLIQWYSLTSLRKEDSQGLFHFLTGLFQFAMAGLFLSGSLFSIFIFWELVGILSYLLVQFWYGKPSAADSALRVILINKAGDFFLLSGIGLLFSFGLSFPVSVTMIFPEGAEIFLASPTGRILCFFLLISAAIKSAQFPFSVWLKRAMAGPASVSALLHSATMVVAGVWLMSRLAPGMPLQVMQVLAILGLFSLLAGNLAALGSSHLKSVLAFSTMAQLGLMMAAIGLGKSDNCMLHLISHAFFKAGLFLLCGWLMRSLSHQQIPENETDSYSRLSGILSASSPAKWALLVLLASLTGLPLTSGFISKEGLFPEPWISGNMLEWLLFAGMQTGSFLTAAYAGRIFLVLCAGEKKEPAPFPVHMAAPVMLLALASGFWLFGFNPFSSEGWLSAFVGIKGQAVRPDFFAAILGLAFSWLSRDWSFQKQFPSILHSVFQEFRPIENAINAGSKFLFYLAGTARKADNKVLDSGLELASKSVVVAGYFSRFTDRFLLDGLLRVSGSAFYRAGGLLFFQALHSARFAAWVAILVLIILIYFSYYR